MKGNHPRPTDRCPFVLRHSISQATSFMQLGMLCAVLLGSQEMPSADTTWPRHLISLWKNLHFLGLSFRPASRIFWNTFLSNISCSSSVFEYITMSSMYTTQPLRCRSPRTRCISLCRHTIALVEPQGSHCESCVLLAVFFHLHLPISGL